MTRALAALVALLLGACMSSAPPAPGRISVEVYQGLGGKAAGFFLPVIELIVDATRSMGASVNGTATHLAAAQAKAAELLQALPAGGQAALHVLGAGSGSAECAAVETAVPPSPTLDPDLGTALARLRPAGEGSLAQALGALTAELRSQGRARDARVVLLTDLDSSCGGDVCAAAESLVTAGAWLDVVVLGDAPAPACLAALRPSAHQPGVLVRALTPAAPLWHLAQPGAPAGSGGISGRAGPAAVEAPPGEWMVALELDRPALIGPLPVQAGRWTRVRALRFSGEPLRFAWEIVDERR